MSDDNIVVTKQPVLNTYSSTPRYPTSVIESSQVTNNMIDTATKSINIWIIGRYVLIVFILAYLGLNLFTVLGNFTDKTTSILAPILSFFRIGVGETIKQTVNTSAEGTKLAVDVASGTVESTVNLLEQTVGSKDVKFNRIDNPTISTEKAIETSMSKKKQSQNIPEPDDATSSTQQFQKGKSGYCYIGEDRGFRSCIKVGEGDKCMSGDIFPTNEICINPNLRE